MSRWPTLLMIAAFVLAGGTPARAFEDTFAGRLEALALLQTLNATLLAARSATFTLESWCADHALAPQPRIRARLARDIHKPPTPEQRARLKVSADEPVMFRHVELACGTHVLSEADNWYVPARLTPEMNLLLETTDTPFGRAVQDLKPFRQTFAVTVHWQPLPAGWETGTPRPPEHAGAQLAMPATLFEHRALLFTPEQTPFCEVDEIYRSDVLSFDVPR